MRFKTFLEQEDTGKYKRISTQAEAEEFLDNFIEDIFDRVHFTSNKDGSIDLNDRQCHLTFVNADLVHHNGEMVIPVKIYWCEAGTVTIDASEITSLEGLPLGGTHAMTLRIRNHGLKSFEHLPPELENLHLYTMNNLTVTELVKYLKECNVISLSPNYEGPLLGLFKVKGLITTTLTELRNTRCAQALKIINKHLHEHDMISCKKELISSGLGEYAKL